MKHLIYKITNITTKEYYIGVHSCRGEDCYYHSKKTHECRYLGSGTRIKHQVNKYGRKNFVKTILAERPTKEEAYLLEEKLVNPSDPLSLNLTKGGEGRPRQGHTPANVREVTYEGVTYPSVAALSRAYGVSYSAAHSWVQGVSVKGGTSIKVTVYGIEYASFTEAAKATGINYRTLKRIAEGLPTRASYT